MHTGLLWGKLRERDHLEDQGVDGRILLSGSSRSGMWRMDWIELAQNRDSRRALVNAVLNMCVPYNAENFYTSSEPVSF